MLALIVVVLIVAVSLPGRNAKPLFHTVGATL